MGQIMALRENRTSSLQELLFRHPWASRKNREELQEEAVTDNPPLE